MKKLFKKSIIILILFISLICGESFDKYQIESNIPGLDIQSVELVSNTLFVGTAYGLGYINYPVTGNTKFDSIPNIDVSDIYYHSDSFRLWLATKDKGINVVKSNGGTFEITNVYDINTSGVKTNTIYSIIYESIGKNIWFGSNAGAIKYDVVNDTFINYNPSNTGGGLNDTEIYDLETYNGKIYLGASNGLYLYSDTSWSKLVFPSNYGTDIQVNALKRDNQILWVGTNEGLFEYDLMNNVWSKYNIPNPFVTPFEIISAIDVTNRYAFIGTTHSAGYYSGEGLSVYDKYAQAWVKTYTSSDLNSNDILSITINTDDEIFIGTKGGGLVVLNNFEPTTTAEENFQIVTYPNPFNPTNSAPNNKITFKYYLPANGIVTIDIYTLSGEKVIEKEYASGNTGGQQGNNNVQWDGKNGIGKTVESSIYICVFNANMSTESIKKTFRIGVLK